MPLALLNKITKTKVKDGRTVADTARSFTDEAVSVGLREVDDTSAGLVSQLDIALERIAKKGHNVPVSSLDKALSSQGVTKFEKQASGIIPIASKASLPLSSAQSRVYDSDIVRRNFSNLTKSGNSGLINKVIDVLSASTTTEDKFTSLADAISKKSDAFSPEELRLLTTGADITAGTHKLRPEELRGLTKERKDLVSKEDIFKSTNSNKFRSYTLPDTNPQTYKEVIFSNPKLDDLGQSSNHFDTKGYQFHIRYDVIGEAREAREAVPLEIFISNLSREGPNHPHFNKAADSVQLIVEAKLPHLGTDEVFNTVGDILVMGDMHQHGVDMTTDIIAALSKLNTSNVLTSQKATRRIFEIQSDIVNNELKSLHSGEKAESLPYNFRTEALKRQLISAHNEGQKEVWLAIKPKGVEALVRGASVQKEYETTMVAVGKKLAKRIGSTARLENGYLKIGIPLGGFSMPLLAEDSQEELIEQFRDPESNTTQNLRDFRQQNSDAGNFGQEQAIVNPSQDVTQISSPDEVVPKVQELIAGGMKHQVALTALTSRYDDATANDIMLKVLEPQIVKARAQGLSEEAITSALQSKGITRGVQNGPVLDENNLNIGQQGLDESGLTTDSNGAQDESNSVLQGLAADLADAPQFNPVFSLDPIFNVEGSPEDVLTSLKDIHRSYSADVDAALGWTNMSEEAKARSKQFQQEFSQIITQGLTDNGIEVVGTDEYGNITIKDPETGKPRVIDESFMDSMGAAGFEIGGAVAGFKAGAVAAGNLPVVHPLARAATMFVGGVVGSVVGSSAGRGIDLYRHSDDVSYNITMDEMVSKMAEAGVADATFSILGTTAFKVGKGIWGGSKVATKFMGRKLAEAYDAVASGNLEGAMHTLRGDLNLSQADVIKIVKGWETATGNKVLSDAANTAGTLTKDDAKAVLLALSETQPGAEDLVKVAARGSKTGGSKLKQQVTDRAAQILRATDDLTNDNIGTTLSQGLDKYIQDTGTYFESTKQAGTSLMKGTEYRFDFRKVPLEAVIQDVKDKTLNSTIKRDVDNYLQRVRQLGREHAIKAVNAKKVPAISLKELDEAAPIQAGFKPPESIQTLRVQATPGAIDKAVPIQAGFKPPESVARPPVVKDVPVTADAIEKANPFRDFNNLLELRKVMNEFRSDARFKSNTNFEAMTRGMKAIDTEIADAALTHMPEGKAWLNQWRQANIEYHKMKNLEVNVLFKALTKVTADPDTTVKAIAKSMAYHDPSTFMQVLGKLPVKARSNAEGAVMKFLTEKNSIGFEGGTQAINFPKLAEDLDKVGFTQKGARELKRVIKDMAGVFKNDPQLSQATGSVPLPRFQNALSISLVDKTKYAVASSVFHALKARVPFNVDAKRAAAITHLSKLLDNPLDANSTRKLLSLLGNDPELESAVQQLAIQYVKHGKPENYGKLPVYVVAKVGEKGKGRTTALGKGVMSYVDRATAEKIARETGSKVTEQTVVGKELASLIDIEKLTGSEVTAEMLRDPDITSRLIDKGFIGLAVDDKVLFFK